MSITDSLIKALGTFGINEFQKNRLTEEALKDGDIIAIIPCAIKESGLWGYQDGKIAITQKNIIFGQVGKSTQIGFKFKLSWFRRFPISTFATFNKSSKEFLFGLHTAYLISFSFENTDYEFLFSIENIDKFEQNLNKVLGR